MKPKTLPAIAAIVVFLLGVVTGIVPAPAQTQEKVTLKEVKISGNVRVEDEGIRLHLKNRAGA
jgi:outer membrane protein assembly factor BamA